MKKFTAILISCSLTLAAAAQAQQAEEQPSPAKKPHENAHDANEGKQAPNDQNAHKEHKEHAEHAETKAAAQNEPKAQASPQAAAHAGAKHPAKEQASASPNAKAQTEQRKGEQNAASKPAAATKPPSPSATAAAAQSQPPAAPQAKKPNAKKVDAKVVQSVKAQHANFRAQPKPEQVPAVTFNQGYRIQGAQQWQGPQYEVFRSYHPEMHDQGWYRSHYQRVELIGGGYYYLNNGYWYPAWGYDPGAQYYAYDAPIYVGHTAEPPDRVIANVQGILQEQGYYKGEVDGLLGPLTREALTAYQSDNGLYATAVIDEPTLSSLGLG
ncbi:MAG: hypothetical protein DLM73_05705 [Chthoniobacterales bacterium]|nr:MAG: hypothetical protein DLM73_05705 [Chthoniobacterales bacterium]